MVCGAPSVSSLFHFYYCSVGMSKGDVLGAYTLRDIDVEHLADAFTTQTNAGHTALIERLSTPTTDENIIKERIAELRRVRAACKSNMAAVSAALEDLKASEEDIRIMTALHDDKRHMEYYNQILWSPTSFTRRLNTVSWLTEALILFRTILLPGLSLLAPLSILIMPFLIFHFALNEPITWAGYVGLISAALKKAMPSMLGAPRFAGQGGAIAAGEQMVHVLMSIGVFIGSIWSQISSAIAMRRIVDDMRARSRAVTTMTNAVSTLSRLLGVPVTVPIWPMGEMGIFGAAWNEPTAAASLLTSAAQLDMLVAVATQKRTCFPSASPSGRLHLKDLYHPGTGAKRILNTVHIGERRHVLLTGPNRGGKSTLLKSVGAAILMYQTLGIAFARRAELPVFGSIISALNPTDVIGHMSLFETEIEFAKGVKALLARSSQPVFLMMDEIFHGTNAHDGMIASQVFLDDLYTSSTNVFSIISTHYMGLPEKYGEKLTHNMCMDATSDSQDPDKIHYTYRLKDGVNHLSSVREILRERGLLVDCGLVFD